MPLAMPVKDLKNTSNENINRIDEAIYESETEMKNGGEAIDLDEAFEKLNKKYYG
jgi:hypothetical protein